MYKLHLDTEKSDIAYLDILSLRADCKGTLLQVLDKLHKTFIIEQGLTNLVIARDAKTYEILVDLCKQYGHALKWVLPFPGDWHLLFNYLKVLTKIYWDAGFHQLAQASGHRAETLSSLSNASNFRRSHSFLIQVTEAIFRVVINPFLTTLSVETRASLEKLTEKLAEAAETSKEKF